MLVNTLCQSPQESTRSVLSPPGGASAPLWYISDSININEGPSANYACKSTAEKYAKAEVDWGGLFDPNFGSYRTGKSIHMDETTIVIDDVAKFQNGFGAMLRTTTYCQIDVVNNKVIRVYFN